MIRRVILAVAVVLGLAAPTLADTQGAVGPAAPKTAAAKSDASKSADTLSAHDQNLRTLLAPRNAEKVWTTGDDAKVAQVYDDLLEATEKIDGIVGPVAPKPKPRPRPSTGPKTKPTKTEFETAATALQRSLDEAAKKQPSMKMPAAEDARLDKLTAEFKSAQ